MAGLTCREHPPDPSVALWVRCYWSLEASASARVRTKFLYEFDLAGPVSVRSILLRPDRLGDAREGLVL